MASRTRSQKPLSMKGCEYLESKLREKCASALRKANTVANKLGPLVKTSSGQRDADLIRQYCDDLESKVSRVLSTHVEYSKAFSGDLVVLGDFNDWFRPRFSDLKTLLEHTQRLLRTTDVSTTDTTLDYEESISPEDSVSQAGHRNRKVSVKSSSSHSGSKSSSRTSRSHSSVKSARVRESLKKVSLQAEANSLAKKQELLRKQFEIDLQKETLDLSTRLAIASAKEEVLLELHPSGSEISSISSKHRVPVKTGSSVSRSVRSTEVAVPSDVTSDQVVRLSNFQATYVAQAVQLPEVHGATGFSVKSVPSPSKFQPTDIARLPEADSSGSSDEPICQLKSESEALDSHGGVYMASRAKQSHAVQFDGFSAMARFFDDGFGATDSHHPADSDPVQKKQVMRSLSSSEPHDKHMSAPCYDSDVQVVSSTPMVMPCHNTDAVKSKSSHQSIASQTDSVSMKPKVNTDTHVSDSLNVISTPVNPPMNTHTLNPSSPIFIPKTMITQDVVKPHDVGNVDYHDTVPLVDIQSDIKPHIPGVVGVQFETVLSRLTDVLADTRNRLPEVVIAKFGGDPLEYSSFVRSFDTRIAFHTMDDGERLNYLEQYTVGTAREIVRSCMHLPSGIGYSEARRRLEQRFGDKFLLSQAYIKKLESWPSISSGDVKQLDAFTTFLVGCSHAMTSSNAIRELDYPSSLRLVVSKLPNYLQERWARLADRILYSENQVVTFARLVAFLEEETRIKQNPVFGKVALGSSGQDKSSASAGKKKSTSAATVAKPEMITSAPSFSASSIPCGYCSLQHPFERCRKFQKILHKSKISFLVQHKLCFNCLGKDHMKSQCSKKPVCDVCKGAHNTLLHRSSGNVGAQSASGADTPASTPASNTSASVQGNTTSSASAQGNATHSGSSQFNTANGAHKSKSGGIKTDSNCDTMPIIPIRLKLSCNDTEILTYAFLDSGSSDTMITEETMTKLGADGKRVRINLETVNGTRSSQCYALSGLEVCGLNESSYVPLPVVYTQLSLPVSKDQIPSQRDIDECGYLSHLDIPHIDAEIGILIGNNVPRATEPWDVINSVDNGPYAIRTLLGWCVNGPLRGAGVRQDEDDIRTISVNRVQVRPTLEDQVQSYFNMDFSEQEVFSCSKALSVEDERFLDMVSRESALCNGHYEICLPLRDASLHFPNNRSLALQRMNGLKKKFLTNETFKAKYISFIDDLFVKEHASQVPKEELVRDDGMLWYLPHHGVFHPRKNKLRVVLDASARFAGTSLNERLLSGPDLSNSIVGVLVRFRQERIAFMSDLECMFYQVKVPASQRDLLRFLWWPNGDTEADIIECRMHAHIFGASSSPAVAKYALRRTAQDNKDDFSSQAVETIQRCFYVDDCLKSVPSVEEAISLACELCALARRGGFRLTQWVSNDRELLGSIPDSDRAKNVKSVDLTYDDLPAEKALGVFWSVEADTLGFQINIPEKAMTRRGIMSVVSSVYDPLGMAAPCVLSGRLIVQDLCRLKCGWDDRIPEDIEERWRQWLQGLPCLDQFSLPRCYRPVDFGSLVSVQLHHFADASDIGYGCVTYLRMVDEDSRVHCAFLFGKSRVAPLKTMTIPRMELAAAVLAIKVHVQIKAELDFSISDSFFWSDSTSVLGYVKNEKARFHLFVANRVALIREQSSPSQWRYVPTQLNPADDASRGLDGPAFVSCVRWRRGPDFLWCPESDWPAQTSSHTVSDSDPEVKRVICAAAAVQSEEYDIIRRILSYFSSWYRLRRFVALLHRVVRGFRQSRSGGVLRDDPRRVPLDSSNLREAELTIVRWVQEGSFASEMTVLRAGKSSSLARSSRLASLSPVLDGGVLRIRGRIKSASVPEEMKHPVILPSDSPVSRLIIKEIHEDIGHGGREHVLSRLRERFWIVHGNALTRKVLQGCVVCRRLFRSPLQQRMADLPLDRVNFEHPPFTFSGVDYFGPVYVKRGRSQVKRYGALFTCLTCRAVHIEMAESLETSAFINVLRRFIARRGQVQMIRSDNGTNFVGAVTELRQSIHDWNQGQIESYLTQKEITWRFNPPGASHHGGVWERLIRSTRRVMMGLVKEQVLSDDGLNTLFTEVEAVLNSRPLTRSSSDPQDLTCLTPNHLLLLKGQSSLPPGVFSEDDNYARRRWRQIQYLSNLFWKRWIREYLVLLQERQKWLQPQRNVQVGDVVLVVDPNASRGSWLLGRVDKTFPDSDGYVRSVELKTRSSTLVRPVSKLVLVLEAE